MLISTLFVKFVKRLTVWKKIILVVSRDEWLAARRALLAKEKQATHLRDEINAERLALPWFRAETEYLFDTPQGKKTLSH